MPDIRVAILDDHPSIIDGYRSRLSQTPGISVVGTAYYGEAMAALLAEATPDLLLLDVYVPTSATNANPYPILYLVPQWLNTYPNLAILVISMHNQRTLIKAVMDSGASGYILKDDVAAISELGMIVRSVAQGGVYLSAQAYQQLCKRHDLSESPQLSSRQCEVLSLCAAYPNALTSDLAERLGIAPSTVRNLLSETYLRLDVRNRAGAIARAQQLGLITPLPAPPSQADLDRAPTP